MSYFKSLGAIDKSRFQSAALVVGTPQTSVGVGMEAFAKLKSEWPRCPVTIRDSRTGTTKSVQGYLYTFKDGRKVCTPEWSQTNYEMIVKGQTLTIASVDLSKLQPGTTEYFKWLCRAQGDPRVQQALDAAGIAWKPIVDSKLRRWDGYDSAPHPKVSSRNVNACAAYANRGTNARNWEYRAYDYSVNMQGKAPAAVAEHRPAACEDPNSGIPPELIEVCKQALAKKDGTSIDSFKKQVSSLTPEELDQLIEAGGATLPPPPLFGGMPLPVLLGGAAAVGLVAFLVLKGKKR